MALTSLLTAGCFKLGDGRKPVLDRIYFPTGLALSPDGSRLYVANSDWDLQYNAGTVQVYDAERLRALGPRYCQMDSDCTGASERCDLEPRVLETGEVSAPTHWCMDAAAGDPCGALGVQSAAQRLIAPGLCGYLDTGTPGVLLESVSIGAFATDLVYRDNPSGGGRLFVPVRSDATLHWLDVRGSQTSAGSGRELECGQAEGGECDGNHRRGDDANERTPDDEELPIEPYGVAATEDGEALLTTHQTQGQIALFSNDWADPDAGPTLQFLLGGLPTRVISVAAIPMSSLVAQDRALGAGRQLDYQPGFWVAYRGATFLDLVRYFDRFDARDRAPFLERTASERVTPVLVTDVRGIDVDASKRRSCEQACNAADNACLADCAGVALEVFLANRAPASLLSGHTLPNRSLAMSGDELKLASLTAVGSGPSRVVVGSVRDELGQLQQRVFVVSFESRAIDIYDPATQAIEARIYTGRGPNTLVLDAEHALGYVAHFTDSYIGVIDLDRRHPETYGTLIQNLGQPVAPRGSE